MKYVGSKRRIVKEILPIILRNRKPGQYFIDLFCGGFNVVEHMSGNVIANDVYFYLVSLFRELIKGWEPPKFIDKYLYKYSYENYMRKTISVPKSIQPYSYARFNSP